MHSLALLVEHYGYLAIIAFFIAEGAGIPFPAETTLLTAAAFAAEGKMSIVLVIASAFIGGVAGGTVGYWIGSAGGLRLIHRFGKGIGVNEERLSRAHAFFEARGAWAAFLGRFVAFLRTVIPMIIGISSMSFRRFSVFNALGALVAATLYGTLGYVFGRDLPTLMRHLTIVSVVLVVAVILGGVGFALRRRSVGAATGGS